MEHFLSLLVWAAGVCGTELAYWLPLHRRADFRRRMGCNLLAALPFAQLITWANGGLAVLPLLMVFGNSGRLDALLLLVIYAVYFTCAAVSTHLCTRLDWAASAYCSVWVVLTSEAIYEFWRLLHWTAEKTLEDMCRDSWRW